MILGHRIQLDPTCKQRGYFAQAAGTARFVWTHALSEWDRLYAAGEKPNGNSLRKEFNSTYTTAYPWVSLTHKDCHDQPFCDIQKAFFNFFKGSNNRCKLSMRLARLHARIANVRKDFLHKMTSKICRENQVVVIEDLNVKGMLRNHKLARAISDVGFGEFRRQVEHKTKLYGSVLILADRWFPSSKKCSGCGAVKTKLSLSERTYRCESCGIEVDRDLNAALNLRTLGLRGTSGDILSLEKACGEEKAHASSVKQEQNRAYHQEAQL